MKPSPTRGSRQPEPKPKKPRGRRSRGKVWLPGEYLAWCQRNHLKPEAIAEHVLLTYALDNATRSIVLRSDAPFDPAEFYDLPGDGKGVQP